MKKIIFMVIFSSIVMANDIEIVKQLDNKCFESYKNYNFNEAIILCGKVIDIKENILGKEHTDTASAYDNMGLIYNAIGDYQEAIKFHNKAIKIREKLLGKENIDTANSYNNLGSVYLNLGDYKKALEYYSKSLFAREKILGKKNIITSENYNNLGVVYKELGEYQVALNFLNKALEVRKKLLGENNADVADTYNNIGIVYQESGEYEKSLEFYKKALIVRERIVGKEQPSISGSYINLGVIHEILGNYNKALEFHEKALNMDKKIFGESSMEVATGYINIGNVYGDLENNEKSLEFYYKALNIKEKFLGKENIELSSIYNNIGVTYGILKNNNKALEFLNKALEIKEKNLGTNNLDIASTYSNLANVYNELNDFSKALEYYNKSLNIKEKILGKNNISATIDYTGMGIVYGNMKDFKKSFEFHNKALVIKEQILGKNHLQTANSYNNLGLVYNNLGDHKKAYEYNKQAYNIYKINRDKNFEFLGDTEKKNFVDYNKDLIVNLLYSANKYFYTLNDKTILNKELFDIWINDKGALLDNENAIAMLKSLSKDKAILDLIARLENYKREYAKLSAQTPKEDETEKYQAKLKELDNQISNAEKELGKHATSIQNALDIKDIKTADVAGYLKDNELFIDFGYIGNGYYAFSVDNKGVVEFQALEKDDARILDDKIKAFRANVYKIIDNKESDISGSNQNAKKELESIYKLVFEKALANRAKDYDSLIISGDGMLRLLPFEALRFDDKYLIESKNIRYASSAKEFVRAHKFNNAENSSTLSVFSDPDYDKTGNEKAINIDDSASTRALGRAGVFTRLRGFKIEADAIQEQASGEVKMYSRSDANEINLFAQKSPKILHIITHGIFINDENIINPMLKSGIALSGANTKDKEGVVMALKLSGLNLKGTDMVVLSACETGVIDPKDTSSAAALPKTFIQAGAKNVMMSLWKVDDAHTVRLMKEFYADTSKGNYNELLKNSKLEMIKEGIHPYYWAGFIISGE